MNEPRERGAKFFGDVLGSESESGLREEFNRSRFGSETAKFSADFAFGTIWEREGLERKQRSLVVLGILIAQRSQINPHKQSR